MKYKYGEYSKEQISSVKLKLRKQIYFLLICVDPKTKDDYNNINVPSAFDSLLHELGGLNKLLLESPELIRVMSLLEEALNEYYKPRFCFNVYRKLILDAGAEILKVKEE